MVNNVTYEKLFDIRQLYKKKDSLKTNLVKNNVAYSWMRSKLLKVNENKGNKFYDKDLYESEKLRSIFNQDFMESHFDLEKYKICLLDLKGNMIFKVGNDAIDFEYKNVHSDYIGTNGMGLTLSSLSNTIIRSTEHYLETFDDLFTKGILINNEEGAVALIGIIGTMESYDEVDLNEVESVFNNITIVGESDKVIENTSFGLSLYTKILPDLEAFVKNYEDRVNSPIVFINCEDSEMSELAARCLHQRSEIRNYPFIPLKLGSDLYHKPYEIINQLDVLKGTIYIDKIEKLPLDLQVNLVNSIDCKQINSNAEKRCNAKVLKVYISSEFDIKTLKESKACKLNLLSRIETVNLNLKKFTDMDIDCVQIFKQYLQLFEKNSADYTEYLGFIEDNILFIRAICNTLSDLLALYSTFVNNGCKNGGNVDEIVENFINRQSYAQVLNLKEIEESSIRKALKVSNSNINKACKRLGISRSTLYRKIKEFQIEL